MRIRVGIGKSRVFIVSRRSKDPYKWLVPLLAPQFEATGYERHWVRSNRTCLFKTSNGLPELPRHPKAAFGLLLVTSQLGLFFPAKEEVVTAIKGRQSPSFLHPEASWLRLSMEDPTPPLDTPKVVGGLEARLFEGPKSIRSLWAEQVSLSVLGFV